jgi:hypothetical protein
VVGEEFAVEGRKLRGERGEEVPGVCEQYSYSRSAGAAKATKPNSLSIGEGWL